MIKHAKPDKSPQTTVRYRERETEDGYIERLDTWTGEVTYREVTPDSPYKHVDDED